MDKKILDACCGGRMMWFDKKHPDALYVDNRTFPRTKLADGSNFAIAPDTVMDFRKLDLPDESFSLVVFDPPHIFNASEKSVIGTFYGALSKETWEDDLRRGFSECFRVLKPDGVLIFKWNEVHVPVSKVIALSPVSPLFGHKSGRQMKTHWMCFMKLTPTPR